MSASKIYISKTGTCYAVRPAPSGNKYLICYQSKRLINEGVWWASSSTGPFDTFKEAHEELVRLANDNDWALMNVEIGAAVRWLP